MNRTMLITAATTIAAAFAPPLQAKDHDGDRGGRGGGGGARANVQAQVVAPQAQPQARAQARVQQAPRMQASRVEQAPRMQARVQQQQDTRAATQAQALAVRQSAQQDRQQRMQAQASTQAQMQQRAAIANARSTTERQNRQSPTVAFGGSVSRDSDRRDWDRDRNFRNDRFRPPGEVFRNWDRGRIHTWNNHRYRWYNNDWVIITGGGFADPYYYDSTPYYDADVYAGATTAAPFDSVSEDMASDVQEALARRGYNPGTIDGVLGPQTRNAIAAFQSDHRMPATGRIDRALLSALDL